MSQSPITNSSNSSVNLPSIKISYCVKCKWSLRAVWYAQEILQTFTNNPKYPNYHIPEISLIPSLVPGTFKIEVHTDLKSILGEEKPFLIWERKRDGGFPDSKILKQRIRDLLFPGEELGHVDGHKQKSVETDKNTNTSDQGASKDTNEGLLVSECIECSNINSSV